LDPSRSFKPGRLTSPPLARVWTWIAWYWTKQAKALVAASDGRANCAGGSCGIPLDTGQEAAHMKSVHALHKAIRWGGATPENYYNLYWHYHYLRRFEEGPRRAGRRFAVRDHLSRHTARSAFA